MYLQNITKLQVFIDDFRITAADLRTIAQGGTPPRVAALAQLKKRCRLVWVAVTPVTDSYSWAGRCVTWTPCRPCCPVLATNPPCCDTS